MKKVLLYLSLICLSFTTVSPVLANATAMHTLKDKVVSSGDGLYKDTVTDGRYVFKGANPNNYIKFNDELWRIMSLEKDGSLKIIRTNPLDTRVDFDVDKSSPSGNNYCNWAQFGCNAWAKMKNFSNGVYAGVDEDRLENGKYTQYNKTFELKGRVENNSSINDFLNTYFYDSLSKTAKNQIVSYDYNIGGVSLESDEYNKKVLSYLKELNDYNYNKGEYERYLNSSSAEYYKSKMDEAKVKMDEAKPLYDSYFTEINDILKGNVSEENKYAWNGNVAMASLTDVLEATTDTNKCGTLNLINDNGKKIDSESYSGVQWKQKAVDEYVNNKGTSNEYTSYKYASFGFPNLTNDCYESNYLIPSDKYSFTDFNYLLITPVYNSNELVYSVSNQGLNPQYVYQDFGSVYYNSFYIKPVVHLNSLISITGGEGSENNPYTLSNMSGSGRASVINSAVSQIVDVPSTSMFTSIFIIGGAVTLLGISLYLYLKVFKSKKVNY